MLLGPSGCGKTTTLRAIAGLEDIEPGDIRSTARRCRTCAPADRDIAFVFQLFALYPHLTAYDNIAFPLRATPGEPGARSTPRCGRWRARCRSSTCSSSVRRHLSGGDMQRIAIGRALVRRPKAMLMDEPIGALDAKLREDMRTELKRLHIENDFDHRLRHPRPGRGDGAGRPHRGDERRRAPAGRHADRGLSRIRPTCSSPSSSAAR